jgi:hypothetical protein
MLSDYNETPIQNPQIRRVYEGFLSIDAELDVSPTMYSDDSLYEFVMMSLHTIKRRFNKAGKGRNSSFRVVSEREETVTMKLENFRKEKDNFLI